MPAGNQQQQPLQSVHVAFVLSGLHTEVHVEPPLEADPLDPLALPLEPLLLVEPLLPAPLLAEPLLLVLLLAEPLLLVLLLADPLLLVLLLAEPLLPAPLLAEPLLLVLLLAEPLLLVPLPPEPLLPVLFPLLLPLSSPEEPPLPLVLLLQAASPTVDEAPITTTTWNSLSIFMEGGIPRTNRQGPPITMSAAEVRTSRVAKFRGTRCPSAAKRPRPFLRATDDGLECQPGKCSDIPSSPIGGMVWFMNIEKLFQVIVVMGASSTAGLAACSSSSGGSGGSSGDDSGSSSGATGSSSGSSGATTDGSTDGAMSTSGGDGSACSAVCHADPQLATWIDCNGCCCWLPAGSTSAGTTPICGAEPCCTGRGR